MTDTLNLKDFQKGLYLNKDGAWYHDGDLVRHQRLSNLLHRCIKRKTDGGVGVTTGRDWLDIQCEDAPLRVIQVENIHGQLRLTLSNETKYLLSPHPHWWWIMKINGVLQLQNNNFGHVGHATHCKPFFPM